MQAQEVVLPHSPGQPHVQPEETLGEGAEEPTAAGAVCGSATASTAKRAQKAARKILCVARKCLRPGAIRDRWQGRDRADRGPDEVEDGENISSGYWWCPREGTIRTLLGALIAHFLHFSTAARGLWMCGEWSDLVGFLGFLRCKKGRAGFRVARSRRHPADGLRRLAHEAPSSLRCQLFHFGPDLVGVRGSAPSQESEAAPEGCSPFPPAGIR